MKSDVDCTSIISNTQEATVIVRPVLDVLKGYNSPSSLSGSPGNSNHSTGDIPGEIAKMQSFASQFCEEDVLPPPPPPML